MSTNQSVTSAAEVEILKAIYASINRNDIPAALLFLDPQIERIEPEGFPSSGTYHGHEEMKAHLAQGRGTWAEGSCEPEGFIIVGDRVVVLLHVKVRLKNKQEWIDARFADGFIFRNGKVLQMRTFPERQQALDWAGATASSPILF